MPSAVIRSRRATNGVFGSLCYIVSKRVLSMRKDYAYVAYQNVDVATTPCTKYGAAKLHSSTYRLVTYMYSKLGNRL